MTTIPTPPAPPAPESLAALALELGEGWTDVARLLRTAPGDTATQRMVGEQMRLLHLLSVQALAAVQPLDGVASSLQGNKDRAVVDDRAAANDAPASPGDVRTTADGGIRLVGEAAHASLCALEPQAAAWLVQRSGLTLRVLERPPAGTRRRRTDLARLLENAVRKNPVGPSMLNLIRRALNRTPTPALRAEAQRQERDLTPETAAAHARSIQNRHGQTEEQRDGVSAWSSLDVPGKRSGDTRHASALLFEIAVQAGLTMESARTELDRLIEDLRPLRAEGLLDGIRVTRPRRPLAVEMGQNAASLDMDTVHVWVSPDPPAAQFFTGGWLRLVLADRLAALAPDADILIDPVFQQRDGTVFSIGLLVVRGTTALAIEPITGRKADQYGARLRRLRDLSPLLVERDPRRLVVVLASLVHSPGMRGDDLVQMGENFGMTLTDLDGVDAALSRGVAALSR
jgi:hypothetical protein